MFFHYVAERSITIDFAKVCISQRVVSYFEGAYDICGTMLLLIPPLLLTVTQFVIFGVLVSSDF